MIDLKKDVVEARMAKRRLKEKKSETDGWVLVFSGDYYEYARPCNARSR